MPKKRKWSSLPPKRILYCHCNNGWGGGWVEMCRDNTPKSVARNLVNFTISTSAISVEQFLYLCEWIDVCVDVC